MRSFSDSRILPPETRIPSVKGTLTIWILVDGKPGHENQALGLAEAIHRRTPAVAHRIPCRPVRAALARARELPAPDWILAAGHSTHAILLWLSWRYRARSVVLMRPSLPRILFDRIIAPDHDFKHPMGPGGRLLTTRGAINRVTPGPGKRMPGSLVLLGGPSKHHGWDPSQLREVLNRIASADPGIEAADSRRTPDGFLESLDFIPTRHHHLESAGDWLASQLANRERVWVTEDSVSMVYEALTSGARVGVLPMPRTNPNARIIHGLDQLANDGWLTKFEEWEVRKDLKPPPRRLAEADRAAEWLLMR